MVFKVGLVPASLLPALGALAILTYLFTTEPFVSNTQHSLDVCTYPKTLPEPFRSVICIVEPAFVATSKQPLGVATVYLFIQMWLPLNMCAPFCGYVASLRSLHSWLFQESGKPGSPTLLHPIILILLNLFGQAMGIGPVFAICLPAIFAIIRARQPAKQGVPPPADAHFTFVNVLVHVFMMAVSLWGINTSATENFRLWQRLNWAFQIFPLYFTPLIAVHLQKPATTENRKPTKIFDMLFVVLSATWWLNAGVWVYYWSVVDFKLSPEVQFLGLDTVAVLFAYLGIWGVDLASGDAKGLPNLLLDSLWAGPPSAWCKFAAEKERQSVKRAELMDKKR